MTRPYRGLSRRDRELDAQAMAARAAEVGPVFDAAQPATVELGLLQTGVRFLWAGVLFEATHEITDFEGRPHRRVIYKTASGRGAYQPGDKGLIPMDTVVTPCVAMTSAVAL